jgi:hypothetical protein
MSGGHFQYGQYHIGRIADDIESAVENNDSAEVDSYGCSIGRGYDPEVIAEFRKAVKALRVAYVYAQRVDWLLSDDDGPESFKRRLADELAKVQA